MVVLNRARLYQWHEDGAQGMKLGGWNAHVDGANIFKNVSPLTVLSFSSAL